MFYENYLGKTDATFTLNFSTGSAMVLAQYYNFVRFGRDGYRFIMETMQANTRALAERIAAMGDFRLIGDPDEEQLPLVAFQLDGEHDYDEFDVASQLAAERGWMVPGLHPAAERRPREDHACAGQAHARPHAGHTLADDIAEACETLRQKGGLHELRPQAGQDGRRLLRRLRSIDVAERRARLARRQRVAPEGVARRDCRRGCRLHRLPARDRPRLNHYLAAWARVEGFEVADLDRALYVERTLIKHLAMRRTLFVFPRDILEAVQAGASMRVATQERKRLAKVVEDIGLQTDGTSWLDAASREVLAALDGGREAMSSELRKEIPLLEGSFATARASAGQARCPWDQGC